MLLEELRMEGDHLTSGWDLDGGREWWQRREEVRLPVDQRKLFDRKVLLYDCKWGQGRTRYGSGDCSSENHVDWTISNETIVE
jgi:hypothetical protein